MAAYEFIALDARGRRQKGVLEADSVRQIRQQLRDRGWAPVSVEATASASTAQQDAAGTRSGFRFRRGLSPLELAIITRHLATLVGSGLPIEEALNAAAQQADRPRLKSILLAVRARVLEGYPLAAALAEFPAAFDDLYRATVSAGEHAGHLEEVLENLAEFTERRQESGQNVQMALLYPIILIFISLLIVGGLLAYVVPEIVGVYSDTGQELPWLTVALIALSEFLAAWGAALLGAVLVAIVGVARWLQLPGPKKRFHGLLLRLPITRSFVRAAKAIPRLMPICISSATGNSIFFFLLISFKVLNIAVPGTVTA